MLKQAAIAGALALAAIPGVANSAEPTPPPPEHVITGNVGFYSQYIFRGLTQTDRKPALQGGFDYAHSPTGLYAGTWASNISWLRDPAAGAAAYNRGGSLEWDFYAGWKPTFGDFQFDLGTLYYWYPGDATPTPPGAAASNPKADTWEVYGGVTWKWFTAKYSYSVSDKTFAVRDSRGTWYLDLSASVPLGDFAKELTGVTLMAHWGKQKFDGTDPRFAAIASNDTLFSYEDWKVGISYALPQNFTIGAFYSDTSSANPAGYGSTTDCGPQGCGIYPRNISKGTGTIYLQKTF